MTNLIKEYIKTHPQTYYKPTPQSARLNNDNSPKTNHHLDKIDNKELTRLGLPTLAIILSCFAFTKSFQKSVGKFSNKLKDYIDYKLEINALKEKSPFTKLYEKIIKVTSSFLDKSKSINNITSLKDILFKKLMYKTPITKALHNGISNLFDNISKRTLNNAYKKTGKALEQMETEFQKLDEYILKTSSNEKFQYRGKEYTAKELLELAKEYRENISISLKAFIATPTQKSRQKYIKEVNSKLYTTFWEESFKDFATSNNRFKRKEMWQTFIAEEQMKEDKAKLAKDVATLRNMITYNNDDKSIAISTLLTELRKNTPLSNVEDYNQIKKLEWFAKDSEGLKKNKELFLKELEKLRNTQHTTNENKQITEKFQKCKETYAHLISDLLTDGEPGEIQKLISIYYKIAPFEFAKAGTLTSIKNLIKSFDKSVNLEISEYFDKVRDLELGSAPTDILTIVTSAGLISKELLKAKNKEQKTSIMLTSGIPLAGAIATTMYATTKLVSGGKSLALGLASGVVLNLIGKQLNSLNQKSKNQSISK